MLAHLKNVEIIEIENNWEIKLDENLTGKQEAGKENWIHNKHSSLPAAFY